MQANLLSSLMFLYTSLAQYPSISGKSSALAVLAFSRNLINSYANLLPILFLSLVIIILWCVSSVRDVPIWKIKLVLSFTYFSLLVFYILSPVFLVNYSIFGTIFAANWYICFANIAAILFTLLTTWLRRMTQTLLLYMSGMLIFVLTLLGAVDLITFYISFEALSLLTYGIVATNKTLGSSEGALKYFIYGVISSILLIFGLSLYYITYQSIDWYEIYMYEDFASIGLTKEPFALLCIILIVLAFSYKMSMFPFHFSLPDVYEGSSWETISIINLVVKLSLALVLFRVWGFLISQVELVISISNFLLVLAILSIVIGCFGALLQTSLKRLFAYTSINQAGFIVLGLLTNNVLGLQASLIYLITYMLTMFIFFAGVSNDKGNLNSLLELKYSSVISKVLVTVSLFSMAGIPPFFGFIAKYWVWVSLLNGVNSSISGVYNYLLLSAFVISILVSLISAYYYLRLIKIYVFEDMFVGHFELKQLQCTSILVSILIIFFLGLGWFGLAEEIYNFFKMWAIDNYGSWVHNLFTYHSVEWLRS